MGSVLHGRVLRGRVLHGGVLAGVGGSFSLADITWATWWEADYGVTLVDGMASAWADRGSLGWHLSQATAGSRPEFIADAYGDKPCLRFVSKFLGRALSQIADVYGSGTDVTVMAVFKSNAANNTLLASVSLINRLVIHPPYGNGTIYIDTVNLSGGRLSVAAPAGYTGSLQVGTFRRVGANMSIRRNGTQLASRADASGEMASNTASFNVGTYSGYDWFSGDICAINIYAGALSESEMAAAEAYQMAKYGIAA